MGLSARTLVILLLASGCGRLGFDSTGSDDQLDLSPDAAGTTTIAGLVAYWPLDTGFTSGTALDQVSGRVAQCSGSSCPSVAAGAQGSAAAFDGVNDCLLVPSLDTFAATSFTFSAWVSLPGTVSGPLIVHENYNACPSPAMALANNGLGLVQLNAADAHNEAWTATQMDPAWHHVAARWDGTEQQLFVDGQCCTMTPSLSPALPSMAEFSIGCHPAAGTVFSGGLDEVRVYDRALTATEIASLYAVGGRTAPSPQACSAACSLTPP